MDAGAEPPGTVYSVPCDYMATSVYNSCLEQDEMRVHLTQYALNIRSFLLTDSTDTGFFISLVAHSL